MAKVVVTYPKLDQKDLDWIQEIRKESDEMYYSVIDPHFSIVFPVFADISDEDFIKHIEEKSLGFKSFDFILRKAVVNDDAFNDFWHVFLVPTEGSEEITKIHDAMYEDLLKPELRLDIPFIPHIGIANSQDKEKMEQLAKKLNSEGIEIKGRVDSLDICTYDDKITTIKQIILAR